MYLFLRIIVLSPFIFSSYIAFIAITKDRAIRPRINYQYHATKDEIKPPRRFYIEPSNFLKIALSSAPLLLRVGSGILVSGYKISIVDDNPSVYSLFRVFGKSTREASNVQEFNRPKIPIEIYEFEGCPFCRKVREAVSILDLDVLMYPCPKGGPTFRPKVLTLGGKQQFPYMIDPNTKVAMYESDNIIQYLYDTYGDGNVPSSLKGGFLTTLTCGLGLLPRAGKGSRFEEAKTVKKPLVFWGYEGSPFCKIVRERLCELEIPHLLRNSARGSSKRQELFQKEGTFQVPYLEDPNTGIAMFESAEIIKYLDRTYSYTTVVEG